MAKNYSKIINESSESKMALKFLMNHHVQKLYSKIFNESLKIYLNETKQLIDNYDKYKWDKYKKHINPYEYIYIQSNIHKNICKVLPISRSYFKLHELIYDFNISMPYKKIACIAESPGGFIELLIDKLEFISMSNNASPPYPPLILL